MPSALIRPCRLRRKLSVVEVSVSSTTVSRSRGGGLTRVLIYIVRPAPAPLWPKVIVSRASTIRARPDLSYPTPHPSTTEPVARWT